MMWSPRRKLTFVGYTGSTRKADIENGAYCVQGVNLTISEESAPGPSHAPPSSSALREGGISLPRPTLRDLVQALSEHRNQGVCAMTDASASTGNSYSAGDIGKGSSQDDFRQMLS